MSESEEDIKLSAMVTELRPKSLQADTAHYFRDRQIIQVHGDLAGLANIATGPAPGQGGRGTFISLLTRDGFLDADLYVVPFQDSVLVDVHNELAKHVAMRLKSLDGVETVDSSATDRWRIFGELPDQKAADTPFEAIRFGDPRRREAGNRVFRDADEPESFDWRHARKWDGHAMRLGLLPDHRCVIGKKITLKEAGYHKLLGKPDAAETEDIDRRVLPVRIDPREKHVPVMAGQPLLAGGEPFGTMLDQEGVCGVALIDLEPWREALAAEKRLKCMDVPILITWPTWLSSESEGHYGPAGDLI
ncbi:MAG: hypothetical protein AAFQ22_11875 [Pseudomonadota bacterium]